MKAIFFDFDGVLADTFQLNYELEVEKNGFLSPEDFRKRSEWNRYDYIQNDSYDCRTDPWFIHQRARFTPDHMFPFQDILYELQKKYSLFIVTGGSHENTRCFLEYIHCENVFQEILGKEMKKTKLERCHQLLDAYDLSEKETIFITDTLGDLRELKETKLKKAVVTWGYHDLTMLRHEHHDFELHSKEDLLDFSENDRSE